MAAMRSSLSLSFLSPEEAPIIIDDDPPVNTPLSTTTYSRLLASTATTPSSIQCALLLLVLPHPTNGSLHVLKEPQHLTQVTLTDIILGYGDAVLEVDDEVPPSTRHEHDVSRLADDFVSNSSELDNRLFVIVQ
eukprot:TRINITY_DN52204_c0_g1_i1.p1 TRINITY_DN52204_c0_g1~~TRINITY_DN52204_c0_g1_i1.p1  ORF type:complete len:134 (-),score=28.87 TRINITY_DN52204_c0_g1_i1:64-465(-)